MQHLDEIYENSATKAIDIKKFNDVSGSRHLKINKILREQFDMSVNRNSTPGQGENKDAFDEKKDGLQFLK